MIDRTQMVLELTRRIFHEGFISILIVEVGWSTNYSIDCLLNEIVTNNLHKYILLYIHYYLLINPCILKIFSFSRVFYILTLSALHKLIK